MVSLNICRNNIVLDHSKATITYYSNYPFDFFVEVLSINDNDANIVEDYETICKKSGAKEVHFLIKGNSPLLTQCLKNGYNFYETSHRHENSSWFLKIVKSPVPIIAYVLHSIPGTFKPMPINLFFLESSIINNFIKHQQISIKKINHNSCVSVSI